MPLRFCLAEREGFEPSRAFRALHDFQSCALDQLSHLSTAARQTRTARAIIASAAKNVKPFLQKPNALLLQKPNALLYGVSWRTKPPSSFVSLMPRLSALLRSAA